MDIKKKAEMFDAMLEETIFTFGYDEAVEMLLVRLGNNFTITDNELKSLGFSDEQIANGRRLYAEDCDF